MTPNNPDLQELKRLWEAAKLGPMVSVHITNQGYEHCANLCTRLEGHKSDYPVAMMQAEWADVIAATFNAFGPLVARLEAAEREREELRRWRELHKDNTDCPDCNGTAIGCETCTESGLVGIYQRDAKQRREGAAEWLLEIANNRFSDGLFIPDRTHYTAAEVREILEQAAQRLREGGE